MDTALLLNQRRGPEMRFVILGAPRSGSTFLVQALGQQPDIFCHHEIFGKKKVVPGRSAEHEALNRELLAKRAADKVAFLEEMFSRSEGRPHVGFKIFPGQDDEILARVLLDTAIRKIVLYRSNVLAAYSSALTVKATGVYGNKQRKSKGPSPKVAFSAEEFLRFHDRRVRFFRTNVARVATTGQMLHWLNYEEINDPTRIAALLSFIGADPHPHQRWLKARAKARATDIAERFANQSEVRDFLASRGLTHWMREGQLSLTPLRERNEEP